jgi:hypothetical protein
MRTAWLLALSTAACWHSQTTTTTSPPPSNPVEVTVSSVTLGDDCGGVAEDEAEGKTRCDNDRLAEECAQTSLQLAVTSGDGASTLRVKKVELVADNGIVLELAAHRPTTWSQSGAYKPWNQQIAANEQLKVMYALDSPDWDRLGGRWASQSRTFQVRVTLAIDANERVFETRAEVAAMMEPMIET